MGKKEPIWVDRDDILTLFKHSSLGKIVDNILEEYDSEISARILKISNLICVETCFGYFFDSHEIYALFRTQFCISLVDKAVHLGLTTFRFDILKNILSLIDYDTLREAIYGKPMQIAFREAVNTKACSYFTEWNTASQAIAEVEILLEKEF